MYLICKFFLKTLLAPFLFEAVNIDALPIPIFNGSDTLDYTSRFSSSIFDDEVSSPRGSEYLGSLAISYSPTTNSFPAISTSTTFPATTISSLPSSSPASPENSKRNALCVSSTPANFSPISSYPPIIPAAAGNHRMDLIRPWSANPQSGNPHSVYATNTHTFSPDLTRGIPIAESSPTMVENLDAVSPRRPHRQFIKVTSMSKKIPQHKSTRYHQSGPQLVPGGKEAQKPALGDGLRPAGPLAPVVPVHCHEPVQTEAQTKPGAATLPDLKARAYSVVNVQKANLGLIALKPTTKSLGNTATRPSTTLHNGSQDTIMAAPTVSPSQDNFTKVNNHHKRLQPIASSTRCANNFLEKRKAEQKAKAKEDEEDLKTFYLEMKGRGKPKPVQAIPTTPAAPPTPSTPLGLTVSSQVASISSFPSSSMAAAIPAQDSLTASPPSTSGKGKGKGRDLEAQLPSDPDVIPSQDLLSTSPTPSQSRSWVYGPAYEAHLFRTLPKSSVTIANMYSYSYTSASPRFRGKYIVAPTGPSPTQIASAEVQGAPASKARDMVIDDIPSSKALISPSTCTLVSLHPTKLQSSIPPRDLSKQSWEDPQRMGTEETEDSLTKVGSGSKPGQWNTGGTETLAKSNDAPAPTPSALGQEQDNDFGTARLSYPLSSPTITGSGSEYHGHGAWEENNEEMSDDEGGYDGEAEEEEESVKNVEILPPGINTEKLTAGIVPLVELFNKMTIIDAVNDNKLSGSIIAITDNGNIKLNRYGLDRDNGVSNSASYRPNPEAPVLLDASGRSGLDDTTNHPTLRADDVGRFTSTNTLQLGAHTMDPPQALPAVDVPAGESVATDSSAGSPVVSEGSTSGRSWLATTNASEVTVVGSEHKAMHAQSDVDFERYCYRPTEPNYGLSSRTEHIASPPVLRVEEETHLQKSEHFSSSSSSSASQPLESSAEEESFEMEGILFHPEVLSPPFIYIPLYSQGTYIEDDDRMNVDDPDVIMRDAEFEMDYEDERPAESDIRWAPIVDASTVWVAQQIPPPPPPQYRYQYQGCYHQAQVINPIQYQGSFEGYDPRNSYLGLPQVVCV